jgi:hypothetical protein
MDAPPTTRSAESTAPTSIPLLRPKSRMPSPRHKNYQIAPRAKQEKHATEIGMLFAALADAQHNAQSLRAHNLGLAKCPSSTSEKAFMCKEKSTSTPTRIISERQS